MLSIHNGIILFMKFYFNFFWKENGNILKHQLKEKERNIKSLDIIFIVENDSTVKNKTTT